MLTAAKFKQHCIQLVDPSLTADARKDLATEVRDSIELVHSQEYGSFLAHFLPAFKTVLTVLTKPQQVDNTIHQTRAVILEILHRLPHTEFLRTKFLDVFAMAMHILQTDNEENAITAIHIIFDLHKNYRHHLGSQVEPFLKFVRQLYESFPTTVKALLLTKRTPDTPGQPSLRRMATSSQSFKVMTESPLLVMFVFQLYPAYIETHAPRLLPLMVRAIDLELPANSVSASSKSAFHEFVAAQIKTVSFLAYLLKQHRELIKADQMSLARSVVRLFQSCPMDSVPIRKDLLAASRHMLKPFKQGFLSQLDLLLDARVLLGTGRAADVLRPLAYTFLAEVVHAIREHLSLSQIDKIIVIFSTNLHDPTFGYGIQVAAVRLLLNLIEGLSQGESDDPKRNAVARGLLLRILETMVAKYITLGEQVPRLLSSVDELRARPNPIESGQRLCEVTIGDPMREIADFKALLKTLTLGLKTVIWSAINTGSSDPSATKASAVPGVPSNNAESAAAPQSNVTTGRSGLRAGLVEKECEIVAQLLGAGQKCFRLYSRLEDGDLPSPDADSSSATRSSDRKEEEGKSTLSVDEGSEFAFLGPAPRIAVASLQEEREMLDLFAQIFTVLDIRSFQDVFGLRMGDLFEHIVENPAALMIPQHFLANSNISKYFADILLNFLVDNLIVFDVALPRSETPLSRKEKTAQSLLKLFKILFASVTLFPTNEPVLRLHIGTIVRKCLSYAAKAKDPNNYLQMLRALFKTLTNQKSKLQFELLYRDFMPLVEPLFTGLLSLYQGPNRLAHSELIVELCLMIPARPSTIFPYLDLQIKPIVWALKGGRENVQYGLRTLEFWVDMLQPGYLDKLLARVEPDLSTSLYRLLRLPQSGGSGPGATTLRILGKLGSRARCSRALKPSFESGPESCSVQQVALSWPDGSALMLETDALIRLSADGLLNKRTVGPGYASSEHKAQAWLFLYTCLCPFLGLVGNAHQFPSSTSLDDHDTKVWSLSSMGNAEGIDETPSTGLTPHKTKQRRTAEAAIVKTILVALIGSAGSVAIERQTGSGSKSFGSVPKPQECVSDLSRYFALLTVQESEKEARGVHPSPSLTSPMCSSTEARSVLSYTVFLDAITAVLSLEDRTLCSGGLKSLEAYVSGIFCYCVTTEVDVSRSVSNWPELLPGKPLKKGTDMTPSPSKVPNNKEIKKDSSALESSKMTESTEKPSESGTQETASLKENELVPSTQNIQRPDVEMTDAKAEADSENKMLVDTGRSPRDEQILAKSLIAVVERLCHCCHQKSWNAKWAGAHGLGVIVHHIPDEMLSSSTFAANVIHMVRALMFVIRDAAGAVEADIVDRGRAILRKLLETCFARREALNSTQRSLPSELSKVLRETTVRLTIDLTSESANARETARQCLKVLGQTLKRDIADILTPDPCKEQLLRPLMQRPVRQQPFALQIGHIEAMIFCLQLERPLLREELFTSPLKNLFLSEVIAVSEDPTIEKLTEAEEGIRSKLIENKMIHNGVVKDLLVLRRKAVELLCSVVIHCSSTLQEARNDDLCRKIISSFFKNLQSRDGDIVDSAKRGLKQAIGKHQKPKDLLQQNLRPILSNLADYKKLTMHYVEGLSRVLELFSHWFNVNLGEKLLEHLQRWTEPEKLAHLKRWAPGTEARVGAAILNLFHLLPLTASRFLEKIVLMVIRLEAVLAVAGPGVAHLGLKSAKAASTSPYREPLLNYCNRHATVAAKFFLQHLETEAKRQLFFVMIRSTESCALREELMGNPIRLVSPTLLSVDGMGGKSLHTITVIDLISRHDPRWLGKDPELIAKLSSYWRSASSFSDAKDHSLSSLGRVREVKTLANIFIRYYSHFEKEIGTLFVLLAVFSVRTICDFTFVKDFLDLSVTTSCTELSRRNIISKFLSLFQDKTVSQDRKVHALQYIVIPMLEYHLGERRKRLDEAAAATKSRNTNDAMDVDTSHTVNSGEQTNFTEKKPSSPNDTGKVAASPIGQTGEAPSTNGSEVQISSSSGKHHMAITNEQPNAKDGLSPMHPDAVLDTPMVQRIVKELLDQPDEVLRNYDEPLSAELLRLATILIRYMPNELGRFRKELIKFGWNHLKREDSIAKQRAFVNVSRFFEAYQAPVKIILQVFVALLRACQSDGKELVQEALDILTPALPHRLEHKPTDHKYPIWIRYTKKILLEEGHSPQNLVHIWQLIARHASLFYVARAQFVPIMVNSLTRIGLNASASSENRRLALDLVDLIVRWERTRRANHENGGHCSDDQAFGNGQQPGVKKRTREEQGRASGTADGSSKVKDVSQAQDGPNEPPAKTRKSDDSQPIPVSSSPSRPIPSLGNRDTEDFKPSAAMTDVLVHFLVQIPFRGLDRREGPLVTKRCIVLLKEASDLWPDSVARLTFVEKLLAPTGADKAVATPQQEVKPASNQGSHDLANAEGKIALKGETSHIDKVEYARVRRSAARYAALSTALGVTLVLAKCQGRKFVEENVLAIRALILPSVTENNIQMSAQFAALLKELVRICPPPSPGKSEVDSSKAKPKLTKGQPLKTVTQPEAPMPKRPESDKQAVTQNDQHSKMATQSNENVVKHVYKVVHEAIDLSLKSPDVVAQHCGLQVLKVFSDEAPQECIKYQDLLAKGLHKLTRENLNSSQQHVASAGNPAAMGSGAVGNRIGGSDRGNPNAPPSNPSRTGIISDQGQTETGRSGKSHGAEEPSSKQNRETQALILYLSIVGDNIITLEQGQKKVALSCLLALIERCLQVEVLLEVVRVARSWVLWKPRKERGLSSHRDALTAKEKVQLLLKMGAFERIVGKGSQDLMKAYLDIVLTIFAGNERRPELLPRLERAFMLGMKATESQTRQQFFRIYNDSIAPSLPMRVHFILAKQEWEHLSDVFWIKHATEVLISAIDREKPLRSPRDTSVFPSAVQETIESFADNSSISLKLPQGPGRKVKMGERWVVADPVLLRFYRLQRSFNVGSFVAPLQALLHYDPELAYHAWIDLLPKTWALLNSAERSTVERCIPPLLSKEYHQIQASRPRNTIQALLDAFVRCNPVPYVRADLIFHLGSRWNAWHTALYFLDAQERSMNAKLKSSLHGSDDKARIKLRTELEDIADARAELYRMLHERDYLAGSWKLRARSPLTKKALVCEQLAKYSQAQNVYGTAMAFQLSTGDGLSFKDDGKSRTFDRPGKAEACLWEERWIDCARKLCQWEVLTEFARVVVNTELLHECLWRVPDWSALKELLIKNPVEESPQLKLYQAYMQLQENKLDVADSFIQAGYETSLQRYCALPESWDLDAYGPIFVQFQQLVELQESRRILSELNALSRHGNTSINVEQKIDNVRLILNTWRERLPSQHESLTVWNDVLTWRNHVHAVVVNVLEALKEAASAKVAAAQGSSSGGTGANRNGNGLHAQNPQVQAAAAIAQALPQQVLVMGVNETAWSVHRFAKACRKQGFPEMALYALQKLYPFGTMELTEYFVKTKETARSFMAQPLGIENGTEYGLHELNKCNMDHFNARQKAQLFTVRGKLCAALQREEEAVDAFTVALSTSSDVGSAWLAWGIHCDMLQERFSAKYALGHTADPAQKGKPVPDSSQIEFETALEWREAAVNCYLQAVRFGSRKSRLYLPRVLRLLTSDVQTRLRLLNQMSGTIASENGTLTKMGGAKASSDVVATQKGIAATPSSTQLQGPASTSNSLPGPSHGRTTVKQPSFGEGVVRVITGLIPEIPAWMWIPWIPQLVQMLCRREGSVIRPILVRVAQQYPQAAFFPIRAFMEDRKPIDRPEKILSKEALKMGRPITSALLPNASSAQVQAARQIQAAKENVQRAQQRYVLIQKALRRTETAIAASPGTADQSAHLAKKVQLKEELMNTHRLLEKCMRDYQGLQQRHRQLLERSSSGPGAVGPELSTSRKQTENPSRGQIGAKKSEGMHLSNGTESAKESKIADAVPAEQESRKGSSEKKKTPSGSPSNDRPNAANGSVLGTPFGHADYIMAHIVKSHQLIYLEVERIALELAFRLKPQREEHLLSLMNALLHRCYQYPVKMGKEVAPSFRSALEEVSRMCFGTGVETREKAGEQNLQSGISDLKVAFEAELAPQTSKDFPLEIEPFIGRLRRWQGIFQRRVEAMPEYLKLESISKHLIETSHSDVEVFGQYVDVDISEPDSERHVKIERFSADVRVVRRHSGPSRGIRVIGSDGKVYDFLLEASINASIQSTEDRTAQVFRLLNTAVFAKDSEAHRRRIQLTVPTFVVTGARSRLVSDDPSLSSLAEGLEQYLESNEKTFDDPLMAFRTLASEAYSRRRSSPGKETSRAESIAARVDAYHAVCNSHVPDECFSEWVRSRMPCATSDFNFRKRFAETLGATSLVYYSLAIGARRPQNIMFSWSSGTIHNVHMRGLISGRGILESDEAVPFRLTRNLQRAIGPSGLEGPFYGSMVVTLQSLAQNFGTVHIFLDLIMRDELIGWISTKSDTARSRASSESDPRASARSEIRLLEDCLSASIRAVADRLKCKNPSQVGHSQPVHKNTDEIASYVGSLIEKAIEPENLAQMESSWQAWY